MITGKQIRMIAFDADDTLWVNEPFYREVEFAIEDMLSNYVDSEQFLDLLYERELANLKVFGYGAKGFTLSLIETVIELTDHRVTTGHIQKIIEMGKSLLTKPIEFLPDVESTIKKLSADFPLMIITKGDLFDQESKVARSGIAPLFQHVEIVSEKTPEVYQRILEQYDIAPDEFCMIGNSLKSDILPVLEIGGNAVHIPFHTTWVHEHVDPEILANYHFTTVTGIRKLTEIFNLNSDF